MAKRWEDHEDAFLIYYEDIGVDFIASHDLGRPDGAGGRRFKKLLQSGAVAAFWEMKLAELKFRAARGEDVCDIEINAVDSKINQHVVFQRMDGN